MLMSPSQFWLYTANRDLKLMILVQPRIFSNLISTNETRLGLAQVEHKLFNALSNAHQVAAQITYGQSPKNCREKHPATGTGNPLSSKTISRRMLDDDIHNLDDVSEERNADERQLSVRARNNLPTLTEEVEQVWILRGNFIKYENEWFVESYPRAGVSNSNWLEGHVTNLKRSAGRGPHFEWKKSLPDNAYWISKSLNSDK